MICPNCSVEYREGFTRCSDCDVDLVDSPPAPPTYSKRFHSAFSAIAAVILMLIALFVAGYKIYDSRISGTSSSPALSRDPNSASARKGRSSSRTPWPDWVLQTTGDLEPIAAADEDFQSITSISFAHEIDGIDARIATALKDQKLDLETVGFFDTRTSNGNDAVLNFQIAYRGNHPVAPDGFYVTEAVVFLPPRMNGDSERPARILFYWNDGGAPAWKKISCKDRSLACREKFLAADVAFTKQLAKTFRERRRYPP